MTDIIKKIIFFIVRPPVLMILGKGSLLAKENIVKALVPGFLIQEIKKNKTPLVLNRKKTLIFENNFPNKEDLKNLEFLIRNSRQPILIITHAGEIPEDKDYFEGEKHIGAFGDLVRALPIYGSLVLNFDDGAVRRLKNETLGDVLTFGFIEGAIFRASDVNFYSGATNFKINYGADIVPFWLGGALGKAQIYGALAAVAVGIVKGLNLVQLSQTLKK